MRRKPSMARFAAEYGLAKATWCREYWRCAKGFVVRDERDPHYMPGCRLSPYDAVCRMKRDMPGIRIPYVSMYNHIAHGDTAVKYGQTP